MRRPDGVARETAPPPREPLGTVAVTTGTVKWFNAAKGYGVISATVATPWDIWCHFSAIESDQEFRTLHEGDEVEVEYIRAAQDSFKYIARSVRLRNPGQRSNIG